MALAYAMHKTPYVFPIVGCRKVDHVKGNTEVLSLELSEEDMEEIEASNAFDIGFPQNAFGGAPEELIVMKMAGRFDYVKAPKLIPLRKK